MFPTTTETIHDRRQLYRQTNRILSADPFHFIITSLLFVPFTILSSSAVQFYFSSSSSDATPNFDPFNVILVKTIISSFHLLTLGTLVYILAFTFFTIITTVLGIALITYSANQAMQHNQPTFISTFEALNRSYIPLFSTFVVGFIKLILISRLFTLSPLAITQVVKALGFHFGPFVFSIVMNMIVSYALILVIVFLMTIWGSAASIAVLELKSGFEPLQQSEKQSTEFRYHSFSIVYITAFVIGPALTLSSNIGSTTKWILFLQVFATYLQSSLMILHYVVANTVLYVQCKTTVEGDVSSEYVRLIMNEDDDDAVHVVTKEEANGFNYVMYFLLIVLIIVTVILLVVILG